MPMKLVPIAILLLGLGIVGYGLWYRKLNPPRVVATGRLKVEDIATGRDLVFETRQVAIGTIRIEEVRLPNGTWIDCRGDCRDTVRREHLEFWDEQRLNKN